jgi:hypothetical protein
MLPQPRNRGAVLAHRCDMDGTTVVALHNLADAETEVAPGLDALCGRELTDVLDPAAGPIAVDNDAKATIKLPSYGCRWLRTG